MGRDGRASLMCHVGPRWATSPSTTTNRPRIASRTLSEPFAGDESLARSVSRPSSFPDGDDTASPSPATSLYQVQSSSSSSAL
ncbi:hypothetical protein EJB05_55043, partial [Eragrostis curvula]